MKTKLLSAILTVTMLLTAVSGCSEANTTISISDTLSVAERYLSEMKYEQAIIEFDKILSVEPKNVDAYLGKAKAYIGLEKYDDAADTLNKCIDNAESIDYDRIVEISGRIIELAPDNITAYLVCSIAYIAIEVLQNGFSLTNNEQLKIMLEQLKSGDTSIDLVGMQSGNVDENNHSETSEQVLESAANMLEAHINNGDPIDKELASVIKSIIIEENRIHIDTEREEGNPDDFWFGTAVHGRSIYPERDINNLSFLSGFTELEDVTIEPRDYEECHITCNVLNDLTPLANLNKLEKLYIGSVKGITVDLSQIASLKKLTVLILNENVYVKDVNDFSQFPNLTQLMYRADSNTNSINYLYDLQQLEMFEITGGSNDDISVWDSVEYEHNGGELYDLSPLSGNDTLKILDIIISTSDIQALGTLTELKELDLFFDYYDESGESTIPVPDFSPLANLKKLEELSLHNSTQNENLFADLSPISNLTELKKVFIKSGRAYYTDLSPYASLENLESIDIDGRITDISPLIGLKKLRYIQVTNWGGYDLDATGLSKLSSAENISVVGGYFTDLSGFADMKDLNSLYITVRGTTDLTPLYSLNNIRSISLRYEQGNYSTEKRDMFETAIEKLKVQLPDCTIYT